MKEQLSNIELQEHENEQIEFLKNSVHSFDNGFEGESKRLAINVRVLVYDTQNSTSLLTLLCKKNIDFLDTAYPYDENSITTYSGLVDIGMSKTSPIIVPHLDDGLQKTWIAFESWWNGIVFVDNKKNEFSRKDIVLTLANKEGGAHVDKELDKKYADLRKNNSLAWFTNTQDGRNVPMNDQVLPTMRQIAHEVIKTLDRTYSCHYEGRGSLSLVGNLTIVPGDKASPAFKHNLKKTRPIVNGKKISRNDLCNCGSGKKYKWCCINMP